MPIYKETLVAFNQNLTILCKHYFCTLIMGLITRSLLPDGQASGVGLRKFKQLQKRSREHSNGGSSTTNRAPCGPQLR